jgi:hypothetical protein
MASSLPNLPSLVVEDDGEVAEGTGLRPARRSSGPDPVPTRPKQEPATTGPRGTPTLQSLATAKLAEAETRLAKAHGGSEKRGRKDKGSRSGISSSAHRVAAMRELYAEGETNVALTLASEVLAADPFGGLIPVEDEEADPFGGLIPVPDSGRGSVSAFEGLGELQLDLDDPIELVPSVPRLGELLTARKIPRLLVGPKELSKLPMDPRAAFIVGHVDGMQSVEEILDVCPMPAAEALGTIERLCSMGVLSLA